jgi:hypothetical protein
MAPLGDAGGASRLARTTRRTTLGAEDALHTLRGAVEHGRCEVGVHVRRLMAHVRQPDSDDWQATATGPLDGQTVHGRGGQAERALRRLAEELRRIKGPMTG